MMQNILSFTIQIEDSICTLFSFLTLHLVEITDDVTQSLTTFSAVDNVDRL